jgi:predicted ATPase
MRALREVSFANYRAFRRGALRLKPITIIIGANSVGKTAILQLPLLLKQTAAPSERRFRGALKLHGKDVSFGQTKQLFHNLDTSKPLTIEFGLEDPHLLAAVHSRARETYIYLEELCRLAFVLAKEATQSGEKRSKSAAQVNKLSLFLDWLSADAREKRFSSETQRYIDIIEPISAILQEVPQVPSRTAIYTVLTRRLSKSLSRRGIPSLSVSYSDLERCVRFSEALLQLTSPRFFLQFALKTSATSPISDLESAELLYTEAFRLKCADKVILDVKTQEGEVTQITSEIVDSKTVDSYHASVSKMVDLNGSIFKLFSNSEDSGRYEFIGIVRSLFSDALSGLESIMAGNNFAHIGPLRAYPKRFYYLDPTYSATDTDTVIEHLRDDLQLKARVNEWLHKFDITINVAQLVNIISRLAVRTGRHDFDLDITDVGFGISQILPILVEGLLAPPGRTLLIEQPEIHLHPKMQAELGDLLIDIANLKGADRRTVIVETHSEYLINRIRRRISSRSISHNDVAIYYVEPASDGDGSTVRGISIPVSGNFEWPREFYDQDLKDSIDFLKNLARG